MYFLKAPDDLESKSGFQIALEERRQGHSQTASGGVLSVLVAEVLLSSLGGREGRVAVGSAVRGGISLPPGQSIPALWDSDTLFVPRVGPRHWNILPVSPTVRPFLLVSLLFKTTEDASKTHVLSGLTDPTESQCASAHAQD